MSTSPLLSVCLITYNHEKYIRQCIKSVLEQKVNYLLEIIIADDFSTDGTRKILLEYKDRFPDLIKLIFQERNVGPGKNWLDLMTAPKSKYIAYLEGDDYWTDSQKLQKQVDFLENNIGFMAVTNWANIVTENAGEIHNIIGRFNKDVLTYDDFAMGYKRIPSSSILFRKFFDEPPPLFNEVYGGDRALLYLLSEKGKIKVMDFIGSVYRVHSESLESSYRDTWQNKRKLAFRNISENLVYLKLVVPRYKSSLAKKIRWNYFYLFLLSLMEIKISEAILIIPKLLRFQLIVMGMHCVVPRN